MPRSYRHMKEYEKEILELRKQGKTNKMAYRLPSCYKYPTLMPMFFINRKPFRWPLRAY